MLLMLRETCVTQCAPPCNPWPILVPISSQVVTFRGSREVDTEENDDALMRVGDKRSGYMKNVIFAYSVGSFKINQ